jgi:hypothetical protein
MKHLPFIISIILVVFWLLGFFIYDGGAIMHLLLVFAVITIV